MKLNVVFVECKIHFEISCQSVEKKRFNLMNLFRFGIGFGWWCRYVIGSLPFNNYEDEDCRLSCRVIDLFCSKSCALFMLFYLIYGLLGEHLS